MEKELNYKEAAEIIAKCPQKRLRIVIELLQKAGYEIDYDEEVKKKGDRRGERETLKEKREGVKTEKWLDTDNETALLLRAAYKEGLNFTRLAEKSGFNRTTLYRYMWGYATPSARGTIRIKDALKNM